MIFDKFFFPGSNKMIDENEIYHFIVYKILRFNRAGYNFKASIANAAHWNWWTESQQEDPLWSYPSYHSKRFCVLHFQRGSQICRLNIGNYLPDLDVFTVCLFSPPKSGCGLLWWRTENVKRAVDDFFEVVAVLHWAWIEKCMHPRNKWVLQGEKDHLHELIRLILSLKSVMIWYFVYIKQTWIIFEE